MKKEISTCLEGVKRGRQKLVEEDVEGIVVGGHLERGLQRWRFDRQRGTSWRHPEHKPGLGSSDMFMLLRSSERVGRRGGLEVLSSVRS